MNNVVITDMPFAVFSSEADKDYILARLINFSGTSFGSRVGYLGQQACEKYLKALSVQEEKLYLKTHDLIVLTNYCTKYDSKFGEVNFLDKLRIFDDLREVGRYGGESFYDPHAQIGDGFKIKGVATWFNKNIKILDEIVYSLRSKLDFPKINWGDSLKKIIEGNDDVMGTWKFPVSLKEILTHDNEFFIN